MMVTAHMVTEKDLQTQLIHKAQQKGALSYDDILAAFPEAENDIDLLDSLMEGLQAQGIAFHVAEAAPQPPIDSEPLDMHTLTLNDVEDFDSAMEGDDITYLTSADLIDDAGYQQALDTDDVVGLYLKEAGRVPLLTAEQEVDLAKRMEAAVFAKVQISAMGSLLSPDDVYTLQDIILDGEMAQEHLVRANARLVISVAKKYIGARRAFSLT